jgi:tetratricopeptide (TPR) repeat protein
MSQRTGQKRRLSVAMIVRNSEDALAESLASIRHFVDEVIVLDTGSTDRTAQVVQQFGATLQRSAWDDSFATARNQCLTHTSGEWVLWLDAGERIDRADGSLLREFIDEHADPGAVYSLRIAVPAAEHNIGGEQVARVRLHPNRPGLQFFGRIRENLDRSLTAFSLRKESLPITLHRGEREHDERLKRSRAQRNIHLADLQIAQRGPSADLLNCLGEAFQSLGDSTRAVQHYERAQQLAEPASVELLEAYYGLLTCFDGRSDNRMAQLQLCLQAVEVFSVDAQLLCALGGYLQSLGHVELACRSYDLAFRHGQVQPEVWHLPEIREIAATCRAIVQQQLGKDDEARTSLMDARIEYPNSLRLTRQALELAVKHGRQEEAADILDQLPRGTPQLDSLRSAAKGACLAARNNWPAARTYLDAAFAAGCREKLCLKWLVAACLELQDRNAAIAALAAWEQAEGRTEEVQQWRAKIGEIPAVGSNSSKPPSIGTGRIRVDQAPTHAVGSPSHSTLRPTMPAPR